MAGSPSNSARAHRGPGAAPQPSRIGTPESRPITPGMQDLENTGQSPASSRGVSRAGGARHPGVIRSVKIKFQAEESAPSDEEAGAASPSKPATQETAAERELRTTWGLAKKSVTAKGVALVRMGFGEVDVLEEYHALCNLREANRKPPPLNEVEECNTWELLGGTRAHNRCFTFGVDQHGQLGQGASTFVGASEGPPVRAPKSVKEGQRFVSVACGQSHTVAITEDGALYSWGLNEDGQLGLVSPHRQQHQQQAEAQGAALPPIKSPDAGEGPGGSGSDTQRSSAVITGQDSLVELELSMRKSLPGKYNVTRVVVPKGGRMVSQPVRCWLGMPVALVACGQLHTVVALKDAGVLVWGSNQYGQLGLGDSEPRRMPLLLPAFNKLRVSKLSAGKAHNFAVDSLGRMWSFGGNKLGQCGRTPAEHLEPEILSLKEGLGMIKSVACGQAHTLVLLTNGDVFSCGYDAWGALGLGNAASVDQPVRCFLTAIDGLPPCKLVAASNISMAVTTEGTLMVWGRSKWISHPKDADQKRCVPLPLEWLAKETIATVSCSLESAVALSDSGAIHVWGRKKNLLATSRPSTLVTRECPEEAEDSEGMEPEMIIGKAVEELCSNVLMDAACGDGFCVILSEREIWDVPYSVLKRAVFALWQQYRLSIGGAAAQTQRARQGGGRARRRGGPDEDDDDGLMTFPVFVLLCKETRLLSNRNALTSLVIAYEKAAGVALRARTTTLPKFLKVAEVAARRAAPEASAKGPGLLERAKTKRWDAAVAAINQLEAGEGDLDDLDLLGIQGGRSSQPSKDGSHKSATLTSRLKSRRVSTAVADGQMKKISQQIQNQKQARLSLLETSLGFSECLNAMMEIAREHLPEGSTDQEMLRSVALHLSVLKHRNRNGPSSLLTESCTPNLIKSLAAKGDIGVMLRIYAYLLSPTPDRDDLNIPLPDLQMALNELGDNIGVNIKRVATFLREALVVPKVVAQYASHLQQEDDPELYELAQEITMKESTLAEKVVEDKISQSALEHRDEMLAKVLLELHGPCPKVDPECVTLPDFLSLFLMVVAIKSVSNNNKIRRDATQDPAAQDLNYDQAMTKIKRYREKKLFPWKYFDRQRTEEEIQQEVDRVFAMYCTLDTTSYSVEIDQKTFRRFCKDAKLADNRLTITKLDLLFLTNINKEREKQRQLELANKPPSRTGRRTRTSFVASDHSDSDTQSRQRYHRPLGSRRRSTATKEKSPLPGPPPKLAEVLKKSELGSLVRALKESKGDRSGRSQRDAFTLAAMMIKDREKLRRTFKHLSVTPEVAGSDKEGGSNPAGGSSFAKAQSNTGGARSMVSSQGSARASLTGTRDPFEKNGRPPDMTQLSVEEKGGIGMTGKHQGARKRAVAVDRSGFGSVLKDIAETKFKSKRDPVRELVEKHLLSLSHSAMERYDSVMEQLLEPEVNDIAERFSASLQQNFKSYCSMDGNIAYSHAEVTWAMMEEANSTLSFKEFAFMAHDFGIVPNIVTSNDAPQIKELEFIYRRANFSTSSDDSIQTLSYSEFIDALGLVAIYGFGKERFKGNYPTSVDKMTALFSFMGFTEGQADEEKESKKADEGQEAYRQWWDLLPMNFDPPNSDDEGGKVGHTWYYQGTEAYPMCLVPEIVSIPSCPPEVATHLQAAADLHSQGEFQQALDAYSNALTVWVRLTDELRLTRSGELRPETKLYFAAAVGSVLQSNGQDREALEQYVAVEKEVRKLPDHHPDIALLHSLIGAAEYHMGHYEEAFSRFVRAKVMRDGLPDLGPHHVDTAVACNNLACVLDKAGYVGKALYLAQYAHRVLAGAVGLSHPRTVLVDRNLGHLSHRGFSLEEPSLNIVPHPATHMAMVRNARAIQRRNDRQRLKGHKPKKGHGNAEDATSRIAKLKHRTQAKTDKDLRRRARQYGEKPPTEAEQLKSLYDHMREDIDKTKHGVLEGAGVVLSGELGKGKTLGMGMSMLMMAGFNVRLPEPEKKVKVKTVQIRTTKKFAAAMGSTGSTRNMGVHGELVYSVARRSRAATAAADKGKAPKKRTKKKANSSDSSDGSSGDDSDYSGSSSGSN